MNVSVRHNGVNITDDVISYEREHKICTGIGTLELTVSLTSNRTFEPWDEIDIYENGSFQVKYFISEVGRGVPSGTITISCQDESKRLVDYFIPDSYTVEEPTFTRYWIQKFLDEAGINYQFTTSSPGNLLSNFTHLGLCPAYEQIMQLLQLSGWYMYFDGNSRAIIGSLKTDLSNVQGTYGEDRILSISVNYDDKMLRNRAVVWGSFDPLRGQSAFAEVKTITRWNYDTRDYRTMVVSNNNIPTVGAAYSIANTLIKEFARITIEKHVSIADAQNKNLGDVIRLRTRAWNGSGLITTFGISMSKQGLITNITLDERCPRLFGFFDFGDYVYVGTYGSGVWRKHIRFEHTWHNFSSGLMDLAVTDLHINNDVFGAVAASGQGYYAQSSDGPWIPFTVTSLESSVLDEVEVGPSGELPEDMEVTSFSGLMVRATIVDKVTNWVKYGIDTYSGLNYGDYFMMYSGWVHASGISSSGVTASGSSSSGYRSWLVEFDPFTLASGVYPVSISGNFNMMVVDLENDGVNDYISVRSVGEGIPNDGVAWNFGYHESQPYAATKDDTGFSVTPENIQHVEDNTTGTLGYTSSVMSRHSLIAWDNQMTGDSLTCTLKKGASGVSPQLIRNKLTRTITGPHTTSLTRATQTSGQLTDIGSGATDSDEKVIGIIKTGLDNYRVYFWEIVSNNLSIKYYDWDAAINSLSSVQTASSIGMNIDNSFRMAVPAIMTMNGTGYLAIAYYDAPNTSFPGVQTYMKFYLISIEMSSATVSSSLTILPLLQEGSGGYYFVPSPSTVSGDGTRTFADTAGGGAIRLGMFQNNLETPRIVGWFETYHQVFDNGLGAPYRLSTQEYIITGSATVINIAATHSDVSVGSTPSRFYGLTVPLPTGNLQLTSRLGCVTFNAANGGSPKNVAWNGTTFRIGTGTLPDQLLYTKVYPVLTDEDYYIVKTGSNWFLADALSMEFGEQITAPTGFSMLKPFSSPLHSLTGQIYFLCAETLGFDTKLIPFANGSFTVDRGLLFPGAGTSTRGIHIGGFFVSEPTNYTATNPVVNIQYIDMLNPLDNSTLYLLLQRRGETFHKIQESGKPIRVDISNSSPVLTVLDNENTFKSHFINENEILTVSVSYPFVETPSGVRDYRYTLLETTGSGIITSSGMETSSGVSKLLLYVRESGVYYSDTDLLISGFTMIYQIPSGVAERIETSNFVPSGQYIFVTTSGDNPQFFQKDPMDASFVSYSGLPSPRATIIRVDDRF